VVVTIAATKPTDPPEHHEPSTTMATEAAAVSSSAQVAVASSGAVPPPPPAQQARTTPSGAISPRTKPKFRPLIKLSIDLLETYKTINKVPLSYSRVGFRCFLRLSVALPASALALGSSLELLSLFHLSPSTLPPSLPRFRPITRAGQIYYARKKKQLELTKSAGRNEGSARTSPPIPLGSPHMRNLCSLSSSLSPSLTASSSIWSSLTSLVARYPCCGARGAVGLTPWLSGIPAWLYAPLSTRHWNVVGLLDTLFGLAIMRCARRVCHGFSRLACAIADLRFALAGLARCVAMAAAGAAMTTRTTTTLSAQARSGSTSSRSSASSGRSLHLALPSPSRGGPEGSIALASTHTSARPLLAPETTHAKGRLHHPHKQARTRHTPSSHMCDCPACLLFLSHPPSPLSVGPSPATTFALMERLFIPRSSPARRRTQKRPTTVAC